jgi:sugar/nucleoside kinase (ribokinase family)
VEEGSGARTIVRQRDPRIWLRSDELDRAAVTSGRLLHLDGYEGDAALQAARWARDAGIPVLMDAEEPTERREELFRLTDVLIVGRRYGRLLTGTDDPRAILTGLAGLGPRVVGLTLGEAGSMLLHGGQLVEAPGFPVAVVDTTGAGDAFHGAFAYGLLQGWKARHILAFANAVSALKCTRLGGRTGIPSTDEVRAFLHARGAAIPPSVSRKESQR